MTWCSWQAGLPGHGRPGGYIGSSLVDIMPRVWFASRVYLDVEAQYQLDLTTCIYLIVADRSVPSSTRAITNLLLFPALSCGHVLRQLAVLFD